MEKHPRSVLRPSHAWTQTASNSIREEDEARGLEVLNLQQSALPSTVRRRFQTFILLALFLKMTRDTLISQIQRPELSKPGRDNVVKFKEEYEEYGRLITSFNSDRSESDKIRKSSIRECMKVDLLENLIMTDAFNNITDIANLTDADILTWYNAVVAKEPINLGDRVLEMVKKHQHKPNSSDPEASVQQYVFSVMTDLRALGGAQFMKDSSQAQNEIQRLASGLNPKPVIDLLFRDKTMWKEGDHSSISHFMKRAGEISVQVQRLEEINK